MAGVRGRVALGAVCALVPLAVLAPLLGRGFVLSYDMVFVPRQDLKPGAIGLGAGLALPADRPLGRCVAAVAYAWNPYVAERLVQGHWALLVGYAALPWVLRAATDARAG